ncbi:MAG: alpha/beta hydrolase family protein [Candidatus Hermodarchaeota archaeon]
MEFKNKQFDGLYEVSEIQINNDGQIIRGLLYFPPQKYIKPYPVIIYFHGFPQLFPLQEIVKNYRFMLDMGYSFIAFNFRGYRFSEGNISIKSQVSDGVKLINFLDLMAEDKIFNINNINIIGYGFGAFIALILCSMVKKINKLLLISPILNLENHVYNENFAKILNYINRFLPGNVKGISNINEFIELTKKELEYKDFQIKNFITHLSVKEFKMILGDRDKLTTIFEAEEILKNSNVECDLVIKDHLDHDFLAEDDLIILEEEIREFFEF